MTEVEVRVVGFHTCPRRIEGPRYDVENEDKWVVRNDSWASCSYCGSMNPEFFLQKVREGWVVGPTDKSFKVYLEPAPTDEDRLEAWQKLQESAIGKIIFEQEGDEGLEKYWEENARHHVHAKGARGKFYFQHLSVAQRIEFIDLYNDKTMTLGYPGHFYTKPFFVV